MMQSNNNIDMDLYKEIFVENEDNSTVVITHPFDPKLINITTSSPTISLICDRLFEGEIDLNTEFQRSANLWDIGKQSRLIESILIGLPIPSFYFDGTNENEWLIVDGLQRISAINNFMVKKNLKLVDMEFLKELNGKTVRELSRPLFRSLSNYQIMAYTIAPGTPDDVKYNIFKRINTGGIVLEQQEIRHALNQGGPANFVAKLAKESIFIRATDHKIEPKRMLDREFVNRFISFYIFGPENYEPDMDNFLQKGIAHLKKLSQKQLNTIHQDFRESMLMALTIFGKWAFRKADQYPERRKPINKALFEVWSTSFAKLSDEDKKTAIKKRERVFNLFIDKLRTDQKFYHSVSHSTNEPANVSYRFKIINEILTGAIHDKYNHF